MSQRAHLASGAPSIRRAKSYRNLHPEQVVMTCLHQRTAARCTQVSLLLNLNLERQKPAPNFSLLPCRKSGASLQLSAASRPAVTLCHPPKAYQIFARPKIHSFLCRNPTRNTPKRQQPAPLTPCIRDWDTLELSLFVSWDLLEL